MGQIKNWSIFLESKKTPYIRHRELTKELSLLKDEVEMFVLDICDDFGFENTTGDLISIEFGRRRMSGFTSTLLVPEELAYKFKRELTKPYIHINGSYPIISNKKKDREVLVEQAQKIMPYIDELTDRLESVDLLPFYYFIWDCGYEDDGVGSVGVRACCYIRNDKVQRLYDFLSDHFF